nr:hypothetical protein [Tanacetum cinerariifolium]
PTQVKTDWSDDTIAEGESMEEREDTKTKAPRNLRAETDIRKIYTNGASNEHRSGAASQVEGSYKAKGEKTKKYKKKALEMIRSFSNSQISHIPKEEKRKGTDIVGPFPEAPGRTKYLIVAIDYFTKWLEAKPVTSITGNQVKNFAFDNIICRFRVPATIIKNNRTQLINDPFKSWAEGLKIKLISISVYHPQANGLVERANRSIMQGIKTRPHQEGGTWVLAYGTEAVIPTEIGILIRRTIQGSNKENKEALRLNLNLLEEQREIAADEGTDIVGPFPEAPGRTKYLIVAIDYFTKWLEAKPVTSITGNQVKNFAFDNIICRTQLINDPFKSWAEGLKIKLISISVYQPQANGPVERANRSIMQGIKTRPHQEGGTWVDAGLSKDKSGSHLYNSREAGMSKNMSGLDLLAPS